MIKGSEHLTGCVKEIMQLVSGLESKYGEITITSGFRSEQRNKEVGGVKNSYHTQGKAIDVFVKNVSPIKVAVFVMDNYLSINGYGIALYQGYCHFDCRPAPKAFWVYGKTGFEA